MSVNCLKTKVATLQDIFTATLVLTRVLLQKNKTANSALSENDNLCLHTFIDNYIGFLKKKYAYL